MLKSRVKVGQCIEFKAKILQAPMLSPYKDQPGRIMPPIYLLTGPFSPGTHLRGARRKVLLLLTLIHSFLSPSVPVDSPILNRDV